METIATIEEKSIFDTTDFDEIAELKALVRSLKRAEHFSLLFARCNQRPKQKELMEKVISKLPKKKIEVIYFENSIKNLLDELPRKINDEKPDAVFVYGLESSMPKSEIAHKTPFVKNLNASRNSFPSVIDCPLVFWLPDYAIKAIMNGAPDFFSVRSGVFFFENDEKIMSQQISQAISTGNREHDALLVEERQQRIENLKELLKEFQSLPENKRDSETEFQLKDKLADIYYKTANFSEAKRLRKELLDEAQQKNDEETTRQLNGLGKVYKSQGKYEEAIKLYKQALLIGEKTIGKEHIDYAASLNNLALNYKSQGKYEEAIKLYKQALLICEKTIGKEHPDYAINLNNLALVYNLQGKYEEAIKLLQQALLIDEQTIGKEHPDYASHLNNFGNVYFLQGRYEEAIELLQQALLVDEKTIGKEHPDYATRLNNLAMVYRSQGKIREALDLYYKAVRIYEKTLPENHPYIANVKENIEICRAELGGE